MTVIHIQFPDLDLPTHPPIKLHFAVVDIPVMDTPELLARVQAVEGAVGGGAVANIANGLLTFAMPDGSTATVKLTATTPPTVKGTTP